MASLTLRIPKAAPLTTAEVDNNFLNLNSDSAISARNSKPWVATTAYLVGEILNSADKFYLVTTAGTTSGTAPTHTGGTIANGTTQLQYIVPTNYDARDVLNKLLTVDGAGSGLDADRLGGYLPSLSNTPYTVVFRDGSGNFSAGTITANLTGTASNASQLGGLVSASTNTINTIVRRDASGNFSAGTITATLSGNATNVTGTVAIANGGTGATSASQARTNLDVDQAGTAVALAIALG